MFTFNDHHRLKDCHSELSPSQSHWLRYDDDKLRARHETRMAAEMGSKLHKWAKDTIDLKIKQPRSKKTLPSYVNDAIGFDMSTEVVLFYSEYCFGTADTICFDGKVLRIHDLKTGIAPASMEQLLVYAAIFCLEYGYKPETIEIHLRIYQNDEILYHDPAPEEIRDVMNVIVHHSKVLMHADAREV